MIGKRSYHIFNAQMIWFAIGRGVFKFVDANIIVEYIVSLVCCVMGGCILYRIEQIFLVGEKK